ncbi:hypothetical protein HPO96_06490 [Kribbella sandramycini]|uniref:Uncharacterized protein n=1 Tax=Kribbella sandramycini TaxID=60450 RepID=A0A7Y4KYA1_9ACTN|nr:hypothetical protein [Kribbella sandramycini]MBB6567507.1 hypothetical protein [Kribbella sandramycini]NOL39886.1 hypothetical protein [Kribbella sandramycini]
MSRYEVIAHAKPVRRLTDPEYLELSLKSFALDRALRLQRVDNLPDGSLAIVLAHRTSPRKHDQAYEKAQRSLAQLGIPAAQVERVDLHRLSRRGRTLVRTWISPLGPGDPAGDREPRRPQPNPPSLKAAEELP